MAMQEARDAVVLTGAGISAPSGIPTFRDEGGIWDRFDQLDFHVRRFEADPAGFWTDRLELHEAMYAAAPAPNAAHRALARLAADGPVSTIVTQNTDGLHLEASRCDGAAVIELHGNASRVVCASCGDRRPVEAALEPVRNGTIPPTCDCGGVYKPDVVLFGESLPVEAMRRADRRSREADLFLAVGTSLAVEPAASLPRVAGASGATVAVVDLAGAPDGLAVDISVEGDVLDVLPDLARAVCGPGDGD